MIRQRVKAGLKQRRIRSKALLTIGAAYGGHDEIPMRYAHCYLGLRPFSGIGNVT
jgi:hypothetical protein